MTWIAANGAPAPFVSPDRNVSADEIATRERDLSFGDFIDMINPLHHLPVIGPIYRHVTGDTIEGPSRIVGGLIFGGPLGMAGAIGEAIMQEHSGRDLGGTLVAAVVGGEAEVSAEVSAEASSAALPDAAPDALAKAPVEAVAAEAPRSPSAPPSSSAPAPAPASSRQEPLSGLDALRAFARDAGLAGHSGSPGGSGPARETGRPEMPAPTTAASTSGQASTRQAPVDERGAEAALRASLAQARPAQAQQRDAPAAVAASPAEPEASPVAAARSPAGGPPPAERFMALGARAFSGPMTVSASRGAILAAASEEGGSAEAQHPVADQMMQALLKYQALRQSRGQT